MRSFPSGTSSRAKRLRPTPCLTGIGGSCPLRRSRPICPGDEYELHYWQDGGWKLHDRKKAERIYVDFDSVPLGGLYYVKGISRGEQNRTFLYENGEVVWY